MQSCRTSPPPSRGPNRRHARNTNSAQNIGVHHETQAPPRSVGGDPCDCLDDRVRAGRRSAQRPGSGLGSGVGTVHADAAHGRIRHVPLQRRRQPERRQELRRRPVRRLHHRLLGVFEPELRRGRQQDDQHGHRQRPRPAPSLARPERRARRLRDGILHAAHRREQRLPEARRQPRRPLRPRGGRRRVDPAHPARDRGEAPRVEDPPDADPALRVRESVLRGARRPQRERGRQRSHHQVRRQQARVLGGPARRVPQPRRLLQGELLQGRRLRFEGALPASGRLRLPRHLEARPDGRDAEVPRGPRGPAPRGGPLARLRVGRAERGRPRDRDDHGPRHLPRDGREGRPRRVLLGRLRARRRAEEAGPLEPDEDAQLVHDPGRRARRAHLQGRTLQTSRPRTAGSSRPRSTSR